MKIQDKLVVDQKALAKDIGVAIEKINEYVNIIDTLAKKIELAKDACAKFYEIHGYLPEEFVDVVEKLEEE